MKIKDLEGAVKHSEEWLGRDGKPNQASCHILLQAAQTMLELMKAREKATGGEWDWTDDIFGTAGNQTILCCNRLFDHEGLKFRYQENAEFITLAANLTREQTK